MYFLTYFLFQSELCGESNPSSGLDCASADAATATANATDSPGASAEDSGIKDSGKKKKNRCDSASCTPEFSTNSEFRFDFTKKEGDRLHDCIPLECM